MKPLLFWIWVIVVAFCAPTAQAAIVINEILADPPSVGGDANRDGTISSSGDEFVELLNTSADEVPIGSWTLSDALAMRHLFAADAVIEPYGLFVVFGSGEPQGFVAAAVASTGGLSLNNSGDTVILRDGQGNVVAQRVYGSEGGNDHSMGRDPDAIGDFVLYAAFTPGLTLSGETRWRASASVVPEPSSWWLLGSAWLGILRTKRRLKLA